MRGIVTSLAIVGTVALGVAATTSIWHPEAAIPPRNIDFKDLTLDEAKLARRNTAVETDGVYTGIGAIDMLYPPQHSVGSLNDQSIRLLSENSSRQVREFLYSCRERLDAIRKAGRYDMAGCHVHIAGVMTICHLKINLAAEFPCLAIKTVAALDNPPARDGSR